MTDYKKLRTLFYIDEQSYVEEYQKRITSHSTYLTDFEINAFNSEKKYNLFFLINRQLISLIEKVNLNSKIIRNLQQKIPKVAHEQLFISLLVNELQSTNEIENVRSTKKELHKIAEMVQNNDKKMINSKRFIGLVSQYLSDYFEITKVEDFRKLYDEVVENEIDVKDKLDGILFRKEPVSVVSSTKVTHKGIIPEEKIIKKLEELLQFRKSDKYPPLAQIMLQHYMFEYIHPYYDGNGRIGRFMIYQDLKKVLDDFSAITFSYSINRNKNKYYSAFEETSNVLNNGEATEFISEMLSILNYGQELMIEKLRKSVYDFDKALKHLFDLNFTDEVKDLMYILIQSKLFSTDFNRINYKGLRDMIKKGKTKLKKNLLNLEQLGVVEKISSRPLTYQITDEYMEREILKNV